MIRYAVGDIHGELNLLRRALRWIEEDAGDEPAHVAFLGDYIDRGPDSAGVISTLIAGPTRPAHRWTTIAGNHESMLLGARDNDEVLKTWIANGGDRCLVSYARMSGWDGSIPAEHIRWMEQLPVIVAVADHIYVHACLDPDRPIAEQTATFCLWGRLDEDVYLDNPTATEGRLVVHGHTPSMRGPKYFPRSALNLDTGAAFGGKLTVACWRPGEEHPTIFQAGDHGDIVRSWIPGRGWQSRKTEMQKKIDSSLGIED